MFCKVKLMLLINKKFLKNNIKSNELNNIKIYEEIQESIKY